MNNSEKASIVVSINYHHKLPLYWNMTWNALTTFFKQQFFYIEKNPFLDGSTMTWAEKKSNIHSAINVYEHCTVHICILRILECSWNTFITMSMGLHSFMSEILTPMTLCFMLYVVTFKIKKLTLVQHATLLPLMLRLHRIHELHTSSSWPKLMLILPTLDWLVNNSCLVILELGVGTWGS